MTRNADGLRKTRQRIVALDRIVKRFSLPRRRESGATGYCAYAAQSCLLVPPHQSTPLASGPSFYPSITSHRNCMRAFTTIFTTIKPCW
jgi:hypothetical protein